MLANFVQLGSGQVSSSSSGNRDALSSAVKSERLCNQALRFTDAYFQAEHMDGNRCW